MYSRRLKSLLQKLDGSRAAERLGQHLAEPATASDRPRFGRSAKPEAAERFWKGRPQEQAAALCDADALRSAGEYGANIENFIGIAKLPVGVAGPLLVRGLHAFGEYLIPLATSEAALVASYARGAHVITRSGGAVAALISEGVLRTPAFVFADILEAGQFVAWVAEQEAGIRAAVAATTRHGKLDEIDPVIDNDVVFLCCRYSTGDASGQNMVTLATDAVCRHLLEHAPVTPKHWFIEGNFSGDKKATYLGLMTGRGRKVSASITIPEKLIGDLLQTDSERMLAYARVAALGAQLSGQFGAQGHFANGLAALYIATGQDAACVSESAVGFTRMEPREGGLFMSVTLPNLMVGTVGGGTGLPTPRAALDLMGLYGEGKAPALAEVAASLCLAGEISIMAAIAAGHFTRAHGRLARER
ncbi:hydroxymethylglutaryl-CoA reductase [Sphingopyxis sp.]|uniref:hydroxymethylglutaryl-CoA reductase n=1 Tax=Sphingopyxis sp. TaxID=1908224 RepID=UPI003D6D16A7